VIGLYCREGEFDDRVPVPLISKAAPVTKRLIEDEYADRFVRAKLGRLESD
jgi:hypothetical protein